VVDFDGVPAIIVTVFSAIVRPSEMPTATVHVAAEDLLLPGSYEARAHSYSWAFIGSLPGMSGEAARQRCGTKQEA
jgi:hypothetical protein